MHRYALAYHSFGSPLEKLNMEIAEIPALTDNTLRVRMSCVPINPSDLIPITGAYAHRISLPTVAGYEGVGHVIDAPHDYAHLIGKRVLPLRNEGTWQTTVDCDPALAVPVPDHISDEVAARAYINPLAALTMLESCPVKGKRVLLSGAGSNCAEYLGAWAYHHGAAEVTGIYRSDHRVSRMKKFGIRPVSMQDTSQISFFADKSDVVFDALGGPIATNILRLMASGSTFIAYGLLTSQAIRLDSKPLAHYRKFHLRDSLANMTTDVWQDKFSAIWELLSKTDMPGFQIYSCNDWREAVSEALRPGSQKVLLDFTDLTQ